MKGTFRDRTDAGQLLAAKLTQFAGRKDVIVLALPRGGVPVGYEIARKLHAPLDVMVVRKLGVPGYEELAMGAIASGGVRVLNDDVVDRLGISTAAINAVAEKEQRELERRELAYRGHTDAPEIKDKTVILVDDGIATGATIRAAAQALRQQEPAHLVIAVPTAAPDSAREVATLVDEFVALITPDNFCAVGQWYDDFGQTSDGEVTELLAKSKDGK